MISRRKLVCYLRRKTRKNIWGISGEIRAVCFLKFMPNLCADTMRITQQIRGVSREGYAKEYSKHFLENIQRISQEILIGRSSPTEWAISGRSVGTERALLGRSSGTLRALVGSSAGELRARWWANIGNARRGGEEEG